MYRLQWLDDAQGRGLPGMSAHLDVGKQERLFQFAPVMANTDESVPVAELKKLGEERVAAEVKRLNAEWDRLTGEFLPIHDQLAALQGSKADAERLIAERMRLLDGLERIGDRLVALGPVEDQR